MPPRPEVRPNLFIIGAAKCGTTSLHHSLEQHPDIFMSNPKEPGYFAPDVGYYPNDLEWYLSLFADAGDARHVGESSTHYTKLPDYKGVSKRIAAFCEEPRFIYLMRDPIDRIISQYWHDVRKETEYRSLEQAVRQDPRLTNWSDYQMQLQPFFDTFGRNRVLVLTFEELIAAQDATMRQVFEWLGVEPTLAPSRVEKKNARPEELLVPRGLGILQRFRHTQLWDRMAPMVPKSMRTLAHGLSRRSLRPGDVPVEGIIEFLRPQQRENVERLSSFLGREFPDWTTTMGQGDGAGLEKRLAGSAE